MFGPGDQQDGMRGAVEVKIVGNEAVGNARDFELLNDWMTAFNDFNVTAFFHHPITRSIGA
jgi:hypothetical protein